MEGKILSLSLSKDLMKMLFPFGSAYVAEIRKRDWKICWPFCSSVEFYEDKDCEGNVDVTSYEYLPQIDLVRRENNAVVISRTKIRHNVFTYGKKEKSVEKTIDEGISEPITFLQLPESESMESGNLDSQPSCDRNICSLKSNQNDQNNDTEGVHGEQQSNECFRSTEILKHKRPQKVRLLSDILREEISGGSFDLSSPNGTVNSDNMDTKVADTEATYDSDDLTLGTLFRSQKVVQTNTRKIVGCRNNKKRPQVEDMGPGKSRWSNGESEVSWSLNSNKENTSFQSIIGSSASVKADFSNDVALVSRTEKRRRKSSKETLTGTENCQFHLPSDVLTGSNLVEANVGGLQNCDQKSISCVKGSLMPPHKFVPMKNRAGGKDVNIGPYFPDSINRSDSPSHLKDKPTFKRKKGSSFSCNYEKDIVVQANSEVTEIPSSEFDALDDISMEIVMLLAENRREKLLLEAETVKCDKVCLLRSVNQAENPRKFQPPRASDNINSTDLRKNALQVQKNPFGKGGDTFDETTSSGRDPHNVCFPYVVNKPTKINGTDEMFATASPQKRKPLDLEIYSKKTAEKPCACVQKKIGMSPKIDASLTNEQRTHPTFGEPVVHIRSTERSIESARIGGTRGQFSGDDASGSVKSCKKAKIKGSMAAMEAMKGRINGHGSGKNTLGTDYRSFSFNKDKSSASNHIVLPIEPNMVKGMKKKKKEAVTGSEICSVNRNPADFSIPGTGNKFMRRGKSEKDKRKRNIGKMTGNMKRIIPTCVA